MADMAVLKAIVSLYLAGEEKPIARYKTRVKVAEENNLFLSFQKKTFPSFLGSMSKLKSSARGHLTWNFTAWRKSMAEWRHINTAATHASTADFNQVEEYESDSDDSDNDVDIESEELVIGKPIMTRSGRQVKVCSRFDV